MRGSCAGGRFEWGSYDAGLVSATDTDLISITGGTVGPDAPAGASVIVNNRLNVMLLCNLYETAGI